MPVPLSIRYVCQRHAVSIVLVAILAFALWVRLHTLMAEGLWTDEMISLYTSNPEASLRRTYDVLHFWDQTPPLYPVALWLWLKFTAFTDLQARLFSVLGGLLSLVAVYRLVVDFFSRRTALLLTLITALTPYHIYFSREARSYIWAFLLATLFLHALLRRLTGDASRRNRAFFISAGALFLYGSYFSYFIHAAALTVVAVLAFRRQLRVPLRTWLIDYGLIGLLFLPWLIPFLRILGFHNAASTSAPSPWYFSQVLSVFSGVVAGGVLLALAYAALLLITLPSFFKRTTFDQRTVVQLAAAALVVSAYLMMVAKSITGRNILNGFAYSYVIVLLPCYLVVVAGLIDRLRPALAWGFLSACVVTLLLPGTSWQRMAWTKKQPEPYRELASLIARSPDSRAPILSSGPYIHEYYFSRLGLSRHLISLADLRALPRDSVPPRLWIVDSYDRKADALLQEVNRFHTVRSTSLLRVRQPGGTAQFRAVLVELSPS
jgi:uncharacterized membrane protein